MYIKSWTLLLCDILVFSHLIYICHTHFISNELLLFPLPPKAAGDTGADPLRRCNDEHLACWKGILKADEIAALRIGTRGNTLNLIAEFY